nr:DNA polymerase IV [Rhodococcus sp. (in: high G+C Gram-positive bacteria)]
MGLFLLHADADSFFASVAMRSRPHLRNMPMAVVAHVFIASANYPARAFGVKGGMSVRDASRMCPELELIDVDRNEVEEASTALFDLFDDVAQVVEPGSMEEAFLDVGASSVGEAVEAATRLRSTAAHQLGIPVSVGIGRTKLIAKLSSRRAKPDGLHVMDADAEAEVRTSFPLDKLWGVGGRTLERLHILGVHRLADVDAIDRSQLVSVCGATMARRLWSIREGTDDATLRPVEERKTLSAELATSGYKRDDWTPGQMLALCVERVCLRAQRAGLLAGGVTVMLRPSDGGSAITFKHAEPDPTSDSGSWLRACHRLAPRPVPPLAGLRVTLTGLQPADHSVATLF